MNWRDLGDTTAAQYRSEFARLGSPMLADAEAIHAAAMPHSRLCLAMLWVEQKHATLSTIPADRRNPLSLARPTGTPADGDERWERYASWAAGVAAWRERITSAAYKGGVYDRTETLADLIAVYAPLHDQNNPERYEREVVAIVASLPIQETPPMATYKSYPVLWSATTGRTIMVESPVPIIQKLIPLSAARPGTKRRNPWKWVQHETGNPSVGANAEMHYRFLMGQLGVQTSFHFVVDDDQILQLVPCDEITWQSADGAGPGNHNGVSCELCVNSDANKAVARRNAEWLAGGVLRADDGTVADVTRHYDYNAADPNRHHCPDLMMREGYWPTFVANVGKVIAGAATETPATVSDFPNGMDLDIARLLFGRVTKGETVYQFDPKGSVSRLWLARGKKSGAYPALTAVDVFGSRSYFRFSDGTVLWRPNDKEPVRLLAA